MSSYLPDFSVINPETLDEAVEAKASLDEAIPLAGGTDVMVYMESGQLDPAPVINLYSLSSQPVEPTLEENLRLHPLSTYRHARQLESLQEIYPMLATAAREISVLALQSRATWIGNVANASPAADGVPALIAYDAELELMSPERTRTVPLAEFYQGYKNVDLEPDELITAITLPRPDEDWQEYYRKVGTRRFQAISKTLLSARIKLSDDGVVDDVRLAFASVAPFTLRTTETESVLRGNQLTPDLISTAEDALQDEIQPIDDIRSNQQYRRRVTGNLLKDFLSEHLPDTT